jgi:hypothetical protein
LALVTDITERKQAEEALKRPRPSSPKHSAWRTLGSWEYDLGAARFSWSDEHQRIFGPDPQSDPLTLALEALQFAIRAARTEATVQGVVPIDADLNAHTNVHANAGCPVVT